jgi:predicted ATPase
MVIDLFCEGSSDESFVRALVGHLAGASQLDIRVRSGRGGASRAISELKVWQQLLASGVEPPGDALVVLIDGDGANWSDRRNAIQQVIKRDLFPRVIIGCPDPEVEAWYAADPEALRRLLGVDLPSLPRVPGVHTYKGWLHAALDAAGRSASGLSTSIASELVSRMDFSMAGKNQPSLGAFITDLQALFPPEPTMYLRKATIEHIKGLSKVELAFEEGREAGWHVILGDNGSGKTTLIRALALGLIGPADAPALREEWTQWVAHDAKSNQSKIDLVFSGPKGPVKAVLRLVELPSVNDKVRLELKPFRSPRATETVWDRSGKWFSASFGPFRRFSGGDEEYQKIFRSNPVAARHISAFSERVALSEAFTWLKDHPEHFEPLRQFLNTTSLLPHAVVLEGLDGEGGLTFRDGNGALVKATELADGYRSILSLTLELLRLMAETHGWDQLLGSGGTVVKVPGVVLIDEVDAHLHPSWQESVGEWFKARFPKVQFIIATHSPLVCRAIGEHGKVFRLRTPGVEGPQLIEITHESRDRLWFGSLHAALESTGFGLTIGHSEYGGERVDELADLNRAARAGRLTPELQARRAHLRAVLADDFRIIEGL